MQFGQFLITVLAISMTGYLGFSVIGLVIERFKRQGLPSDELLTDLEDLRLRVHELEAERVRFTELEERVEFAERLLAQEPRPGNALTPGDSGREG